MAMRVLVSPRVGIFTSIRTFLPTFPQLSAITIPTTIHLSIPSLLPGIWESILRAVPKKKQSHSRRRMRQLAGKALRDITALNKCPACGEIKRANTLCRPCVEAIQDMWRKKGGAVTS